MAATAVTAAAAQIVPAAVQPAALAQSSPAPLAASSSAAPANPIKASVEMLAAFGNSPDTKRVFNDPAHPIGTPQDPFEKNKIYEQLKSRVAKAHGYKVQSTSTPPSYPDQRETSLCGPATFFLCVVDGSPRPVHESHH
ncbi:hypothetical protein [Pseudomonas sp. LT1P18]|uniref:hypothetical protein n=1 Tax=Pseudomonas arabinosi TaxID=3398357 RepID=UPI0039F10D49